MPDTVIDPEEGKKKPPVPPAEGGEGDDDEEGHYARHCANMTKYMAEHPDGKKLGFLHSNVDDNDPDYQAYAAGGGGVTAATPPGRSSKRSNCERSSTPRLGYECQSETASTQP